MSNYWGQKSYNELEIVITNLVSGIYANHFDKDYLQIEEKKKAVELKIASALKDTDFERAKTLSEELEKLIQAM